MKHYKLVALSVLALCVSPVVLLSGCGSMSNNSTPDDAVRSFLRAMIKADSKGIAALNKGSVSTNTYLRQANDCGIVGSSISDYELTKQGDHLRVTNRKLGRALVVKTMFADGSYYIDFCMVEGYETDGSHQVSSKFRSRSMDEVTAPLTPAKPERLGP